MWLAVYGAGSQVSTSVRTVSALPSTWRSTRLLRDNSLEGEALEFEVVEELSRGYQIRAVSPHRDLLEMPLLRGGVWFLARQYRQDSQ